MRSKAMSHILQRLTMVATTAVACLAPVIAEAQWGGPGWNNGGYDNAYGNANGNGYGNGNGNGYGRGNGSLGGKGNFCFHADVGGMMNDMFGTNGWGRGNQGYWGDGYNGYGDGYGGGNANGRGTGRGSVRGQVCVTMDARGMTDDMFGGNGWGNNGWGNNGNGGGAPWRRGWW
jgi:hypothetical protein